MTDTIDARLKALGIDLPAPAAPAANYVPSVRAGNLLLTSGQLPFDGGKLLHTGIVGAAVSLEEAQASARQCAVNILAVAKSALGDLEKVRRLVKITVFVASTPDFTGQHLVGNGASDLLVEVLGETGKHARSAIGMACLPLDAPVEIEAIFEVE